MVLFLIRTDAFPDLGIVPSPYPVSLFVMPNAFLITVLTGLLAFALTASASAQSPPSTSATSQAVSPETQKFRGIITEITELHAKQRYAEALLRLHDAEELKVDPALVHNIRGSIYTAQRDYAKARDSFDQARLLKPEAFEPRFNLAELDYVAGAYKTAEATFIQILKDYPKLPAVRRHLCQFKVVVCQLKQDKVTEAGTTAKSFGFMDDTPAYYFSQAAVAFQKGDKTTALQWVTKAGNIFPRQESVLYLDALMEAHWIESIGVPEGKK